MSVLRISKIDAARVQLDSAILLFFENKDPVSTCVLMHSGWNIVKDLLIKEKIKSSRDWMVEGVPKSERKDIWEKLHEVWNFCKHANNDPDAVLEFRSEYVEIALFLSLYDLAQISQKSGNMDVYELWFIAKRKAEFEKYEPFEVASSLFPGLSGMTHENQIKAGRLALANIQ